MVHVSILELLFHPLTVSIVRPEFQGHPNPPRRKVTAPISTKCYVSNHQLRFQAEREAQKIVQKGVPNLAKL